MTAPTTHPTPGRGPSAAPRTPAGRRRPLAALGTAVVLALALAACGTDTTEDDGVASLDGGTAGGAATAASDGAPEGASDPADTEEELLAYVECLRGEGLDVPDPSVDGDGDVTLGGPGGGGAGAEPPDPEELEAATEVCGELPEGAVAGVAELDSAEFEDAALAFAECMRENGVDVPDPDLSGGGPAGGGDGGGPFGGAVDLDDPEVAAAVEACQEVFTDAGTDLGGQP